MDEKQSWLYKQLISGIIILILSLAGSYFVTKQVHTETEQPYKNQINITVSEITAESVNYSSLAEVVAEIKDTVVNITSSALTSQSAGSGVIFGYDEENGEYYIVTNHHVIDGYSNITAELHDGSTYQAALVGGDPIGDIAVIKIKATGLKTARILKDSDTLKVGDSVIAIGNPLGELGGTVSQGIISYINREVMVEGRKMSLLQTDTAVNAGNSGGGLFDIYGNLIGIVNAKAAQVGVEGLAFAIPSNDVRYLAESLIATATADNYGYVPGRTAVGASFVDGYYQVGGIFGQTYEIVYINAINENGAAYKAGLRKEDIVVSITVNGETKEIKKASEISEIIEAQNVGDTIIFTVKRGGLKGTTLEVSVVCEQYIYTI